MGRRGPTDHFIMTKNNYFHMKLREHREEIARLKEELEDSAKAALERESATAGMAAEQIDREKAAARVERERVLTQLESVEADRDEVVVRLREFEEREQQEKERTRIRTRALVVGLVLLAGVVAIFQAGSFGGKPEVVVPTTVPTTVATTVPTTTVPTTVATTVPTTVATTVPTTVATTVPTTVATTVPTTTVSITAVLPTSTTEATRATTSVPPPATTTTTLEPVLPIDPDVEEPVVEIDELAVLTASYEMWESGERVQTLQIVLGMQADWIYGPVTYDRHTRVLIDRGLSLLTLPPPPTTTSQPLPPYIPGIGLMYPNEQVRDFKHPGQADEWIFFGNAGTSVRVQMTSRHFDTYLEVSDPTGVVIALNDDHDGTDSFVSVQLCHTGAYTVIAGNFGYGSMQFGEYALLLTGGDVVFDAILQKCEVG